MSFNFQGRAMMVSILKFADLSLQNVENAFLKFKLVCELWNHYWLKNNLLLAKIYERKIWIQISNFFLLHFIEQNQLIQLSKIPVLYTIVIDIEMEIWMHLILSLQERHFSTCIGVDTLWHPHRGDSSVKTTKQDAC